MSLPYLLSSLSEREAIVDAVYRAMMGFDTNDYSLFKSAFADNAIITIGQKTIEGTNAIRTGLYDLVAAMDTTHMISNVRVEVKPGASVATLHCLSLAQHCPLGKGTQPAGPKYTGGTLYRVDLERDAADQVWRIKQWTMDGIWGQGDVKVMEGIL